MPPLTSSKTPATNITHRRPQRPTGNHNPTSIGHQPHTARRIQPPTHDRRTPTQPSPSNPQPLNPPPLRPCLQPDTHIPTTTRYPTRTKPSIVQHTTHPHYLFHRPVSNLHGRIHNTLTTRPGTTINDAIHASLIDDNHDTDAPTSQILWNYNIETMHDPAPDDPNSEEIDTRKALHPSTHDRPQFIAAIQAEIHSLITETKTLEPITLQPDGTYLENTHNLRTWKIPTRALVVGPGGGCCSGRLLASPRFFLPVVRGWLLQRFLLSLHRLARTQRRQISR